MLFSILAQSISILNTFGTKYKYNRDNDIHNHANASQCLLSEDILSVAILIVVAPHRAQQKEGRNISHTFWPRSLVSFHNFNGLSRSHNFYKT
jgi:hypothetical protein